jgi:heptosyltransferase-3
MPPCISPESATAAVVLLSCPPMVPDAIDLGSVAHVLVIKLRHHGDVLLAAPVFSVLKSHAPHLEIDALVYDDTREMLSLHPAITQLHEVGRAWRDRPAAARIAAEWRLLRALRGRRYDLIVTLTEHPRGMTLARLLRPRYAVAPEQPHRGRIWRKSFTHLYRVPRAGRHMVEQNLDALRRIGVYPREDERAVVLVPGDEAEAQARNFMATHGLEPGGFIHLHPASRWRFKCWPAERTAALIDALAAEGHRMVLSAAPSESELALVRTIKERTHAAIVDLSGHLSLKSLAAMIGHARLFVGVDSAPMHIAAAMGTPTVALFGPSGETVWGPWQVALRVVASTVHPCRPCGLDGCGGGKVSECLTTLPLMRVLDEARALLEQTRPQ